MFNTQPVFRIIIYGFAIAITVGSLWYSNSLVTRLGKEEEKKVQLYADAVEFIGTMDPECVDNCETNFVFSKITKTNELVPTLLVNSQGEILSVNNIEIPQDADENDSLGIIRSMYERLKNSGVEPIEIENYNNTNYVYFDESSLLKRLRYFPYLQLSVVVAFFTILFIGFNVAKKNEQNKVWVGLAKETAHQLGTPVSSLMAWVELLKMKMESNPEDEELVEELEKDVKRLETITQRFSKIGATPELEETTIKDLMDESADYLRKRMSKNVSLDFKDDTPEGSMVRVNRPLFSWVIENLLKNALDAIHSETGKITVHISKRTRDYIIDVSDSGKGIPRKNFKQVFKPGFTTKKRGWGLGLSLTKRIIENYHNGKIYVKSSEMNKGTTFRIILPQS